MTLTERDHLVALAHIPHNNIIQLTTTQDVNDPDVWTGWCRLWTNSPVLADFEAQEENGLTIVRDQ